MQNVYMEQVRTLQNHVIAWMRQYTMLLADSEDIPLAMAEDIVAEWLEDHTPGEGYSGYKDSER